MCVYFIIRSCIFNNVMTSFYFSDQFSFECYVMFGYWLNWLVKSSVSMNHAQGFGSDLFGDWRYLPFFLLLFVHMEHFLEKIKEKKKWCIALQGILKSLVLFSHATRWGRRSLACKFIWNHLYIDTKQLPLMKKQMIMIWLILTFLYISFVLI